MSFEEWLATARAPGRLPSMKEAWNAAIEEALSAIRPCGFNIHAAMYEVSALKTPLNTPTSPEQGQAKGVGASRF